MKPQFTLLLFVLSAFTAFAQPDIKHSIYFKEKFCPKLFYPPPQCNYLAHSSGSLYGTCHTYVPPLTGITQVFLKVNVSFDTIFTVNFNAVNDINADRILELPNGNILLAGQTSRNDGGILFNDKPGTFIWLLELDTLGQVVKKKSFGSGACSLTDASISSDGYLLLAGNSNANEYDFAHPFNGSVQFAWVAKFDTAFNKVWIKTYDNNGDEGYPTIKEILPNRYMIGYHSNGIDTGAVPAETRGMIDLVVYYTDSSGNVIWKHRYGTPGNDGSRCSAVDPLTKNVYFVDQLYSSPSGGDLTHFSGTCWVHMVDTLGNIKGSKAYGAATEGTWVQDIKWHQNQLWMVAWSQGEGGDMDSTLGIPNTTNAWIAVIDSNVNLVGKYTFQTYYSDYFHQLFVAKNSLHVSGVVASYINPYKCDTSNITQIVLNLGLAPLGIEEFHFRAKKLFKVYPNPTRNSLYLEIEDAFVQEKAELNVKDLEGRAIYQQTIVNLKPLEQIDCGAWPKGNYVVELVIKAQRQAVKFTKQ